MISHNLKTALAAVNLGVGSIDVAEGDSLTAGEGVQGTLTKVEAGASMVYSKDVDAVAVVGQAVACTALLDRVSRGTWERSMWVLHT